ncbi:hypothetical protein [Dactylosporangium sp. CA-139066]|uniref:hypothetical protein n=1 Tax=Dactylosporangium sp. CA-139066 TaxID=3239930 RepID=UPI003D8E3612
MSPAPTTATLPFDIAGHLGDPAELGNPDDLVGPAEATRVLRLDPLPEEVLQRAEPGPRGPAQWRRVGLWQFALTQTIPYDDHGDPDEEIGSTEAGRIIHRRPEKLPRGLLDLATPQHDTSGRFVRRVWTRATVWHYALTQLAVGATVLDGRLYLDRAGVAALAGVTIGHVDKWIKAADTINFPARHHGRWYDAQDIQQWRADQVDAQHPAPITTSGDDPNELLTKTQIVVDLYGYTNPNAINNMPLWQRLLEANSPEHNVDDTPRGRRWPRHVAVELRNNPLPRGRTPGSTARNRVIDTSGDPDDELSAAQVARAFGYSHVSSLPPAVLAAADTVTYTSEGKVKARRWKRGTIHRLASTLGAAD